METSNHLAHETLAAASSACCFQLAVVCDGVSAGGVVAGGTISLDGRGDAA